VTFFLFKSGDFINIRILSTNKKGLPSNLWLVFQSKPASHEMIACLLPVLEAEDWDVIHLLKQLPRDKPYWGETSLSNLGAMAQDVEITNGMPIMIARHQRVRGLWVLGKKHWTPIGRIEYYTRKRETVTLLQSFNLRKDSSMRKIGKNKARAHHSVLDENIEVALGTVDAAFRNCQNVRCKVILDKDDEMYKLIFFKNSAQKQDIS
jgi:hypothetical protein